MKYVTLGLPDNMADFIKQHPLNDIIDFRRAAFMLYPYIEAGMLSHGKAAELLGVNKFRLIQFYGKYGLQYITDSVDKYSASEKKIFDYFEERETNYAK